MTRSLSLELEERGLGGLPHQAAQLRGPDLHGLPEEGGRCAGHPALGSRPEPVPGAGAPGRPAAPLPLYHREAQRFSVVLPHQGGRRGREDAERVLRGQVQGAGAWSGGWCEGMQDSDRG